MPTSMPPSENCRELIVQFLAELMRTTIDAENQEAFQHGLQAYCDSLRPWLEPSDGPLTARSAFSFLESCTFDKTNENVTVVFSPEAEALFRAWLRRNKILSDGGLNILHAWSN